MERVKICSSKRTRLLSFTFPNKWKLFPSLKTRYLWRQYNNAMKRFATLLSLFLATALSGQECLDFENFAPGTTFNGSQGAVSFNTTFVAQPVVLPGGGTVAGGSVSVGGAIAALGSGQALNVNNAAVEICLPGLKEVSFRFSNQGGYFNFSIDGSQVITPNNQNGSYNVNGVDITVSGSLNNNRLTGEITMTARSGTFECFTVGGQELQIDDICFLTCENPRSPDSAVPGITCVEFEDLDKQGPFTFGSGYLEQGLLFKVIDFDGQFGSAKSSSQNVARHLGKEFHFLESGFSVGADCWSGVKFHFQTKKAVILVVNGVAVSGSNLSSLHNTQIGSVLLTIEDHPTETGVGIACLTGRIETIELSGEDLYIDHFCAADCLRDCIDFEGEPADAKYGKGDQLTEDGYTLAIEDPLESDTPASISTNNLAQGGGQELRLEEGALNFGDYCFQGLAFQYAQLSPGLAFFINDAEPEVNWLSDLDGQVVEGVSIEVFVTQAVGGIERGVVRLSGLAGKLGILANELHLDRVCIEECPDPQVVGFGEEPLDEVFEEGDTFEEDGTEFEVCPLQTNDTPTATITGDNQTGGTGQALALSFATVKFDLLCAPQVSFRYANFGANGGPQGFGFDVRLTINGDSSGLVQNFTALNGTTLGGVSIAASGSGNSGSVTLTGDIESIIVGGFNIQLDDIMQSPFQGGPQCHDFNLWDPSLTYGFNDEFSVILTDNTSALFFEFVNLNGDFLNGTGSIGSAQSAGGSGRELTLNDAVVGFFPLLGDWADVSFRFTEAGGAADREVSLNVNGDLANFARISDADGYVFNAGSSSEVTATVLSRTVSGRLTGIVKFSSILTTVSIGAEALTIDDLCGTQQPAPIYVDGWVVSVEETAPGEITYVWDIEALNAQASDFFVRRSTNLTSFLGFSGSNISVASHGLGTNLFRVTETQSVGGPKQFYRVQLSAF